MPFKCGPGSAVQTGPGVNPASYTLWTESLSQGLKRAERGADHPPLSSVEINPLALELDIYSSAHHLCKM